MTFLLAQSVQAQAWLNSGTPRTVYVKHKAAHAIGGLALYGAFDSIGYPRTGMAVVLAVGIAKELYDKKNGGTFRAGDVAWTIAPASIVYLIRF